MAIQEQYLVENYTIINNTFHAIADNILAITSDPNASDCEKANAQMLDSLLFTPQSNESMPIYGGRKKRQAQTTTTTEPMSPYCFRLEEFIKFVKFFTNVRSLALQRMKSEGSTLSDFQGTFDDSNQSVSFSGLINNVNKASQSFGFATTTERTYQEMLNLNITYLENIFQAVCVYKLTCGE